MSAETIRGPAVGTRQRIPFYRNVKTIGVLAQAVFAAVLVLAAYVVYRNVTSAMAASNLRGDFGFLDQRAGIPLAESPIRYTGENTYGRAFLVGVLNTLRVAIVGVALATVLGIAIGVMRLSRNFLMRAFATLYVETLRNTPLAVQIIFWYTALLTPLPPRILNPVELPGGGYVSNLGVALPWPYPSYHFGAWLPYVIAGVVVGAAVWWLRRRQLRLADRPGNALGPGLLAGLLVMVAGYLAVGKGPLPEATTASFREASGVVTVFRDLNGDGVKQASEPFVPYAAVTARIGEGGLQVQTQNLVESRRYVYGRFYFPPLRESEFDELEVGFADPEDAAERDLAIHFFSYPSRGVVYRDLDGDGAWDRGEEIDPEASSPRGYSAAIRLSFRGFERTLVADRNGEARLPIFATDFAVQESRGVNISPAQLFAPPAGGGQGEKEPLEADFTLLESRPLVLSKPTIPISKYEGGFRLSEKYLALLLALVVYTASFIAEIVRAGLQAVPKGQREAAKALGLSDSQAFRFVIFPQAMRVILPPLISQFLNLTKNSSLAPLAAYSELFAISIIIANQTGASVPATIMIIAAYLAISLVFALVLNAVNARMALVER